MHIYICIHAYVRIYNLHHTYVHKNGSPRFTSDKWGKHCGYLCKYAVKGTCIMYKCLYWFSKGRLPWQPWRDRLFQIHPFTRYSNTTTAEPVSIYEILIPFRELKNHCRDMYTDSSFHYYVVMTTLCIMVS